MAEYDFEKKAPNKKISSNSSKSNIPSKSNSVSKIIQKVKSNSSMLTDSDFMVLQRTIGNQAVCQLMSSIKEQPSRVVEKVDISGEEKKPTIQETAEPDQIKKENKTGLPDDLKAGVENLSGLWMNDVKVHYNSLKPAKVGALAYAQGMDIHVAPGQEKHLPHEAWHVVQQAQGRVQATTQMKGVSVNYDAGLEREADEMGERALQAKFKETPISSVLRHNRTINEISGNSMGNFIQGKFYLMEPNGELSWKEEEPDPLLYSKTGKTKGLWPWSYDIYKRKILDTRRYPKTSEQSDYSDAENTGVIPEALEYEVFTVESIYEKLEKDQKIEFRSIYDNTLNGYCQEQDKTKVIEGALTNVKSGSIIDGSGKPEILKRQVGIFLNRFRLMCEYIKNVGESSINDGRKLKDEYFIRSTGSDPHDGGQHALYLINKKDLKDKKLYKPHSLKFDEAFTGENGILANINTIVKDHNINGLKGNKFPTMKIDSKEHTEEFIDRVGGKKSESIEEGDFNKYMFQLGMLESAANVFGVTDLHADNIIFGKEGPLAIDAECGGAYHTFTGIEDSFGPIRVNEENNFLNTSAIYVGSKQRMDRGDSYKIGKESMMTIIIKEKKAILEQWREKLQNVDSFRIVPISTNELAEKIRSLADNSEKEDKCGEFFITELTNYIKDHPLMSKSKLQVKESEKERFVGALKEGTIPSFEFSIDTGKILMDGEVVAASDNQKTKLEIVEELIKLAEKRIAKEERE